MNIIVESPKQLRMRSWYKIIFVFSLLFSTLPILAQNTDLGAWYGIGAKYKLNKKLSISAGYEHRYLDDASLLQYKFGEAGISYKINKMFTLGAGVRSGKEREGHLPYLKVLRFHGQASVEKKIAFLKFRVRFRYQYKEKEDLRESQPYNYTNSIREQLKISTKIKKLKVKPYLAFEFFQRSKRNDGKNEDLEISKIRFTTGAKFTPWKHHSFSAFWGYEREFHREIYWKYFLTGVSYTFNI